MKEKSKLCKQAERWVKEKFGDRFVYSDAERELAMIAYYAGLVDGVGVCINPEKF